MLTYCIRWIADDRIEFLMYVHGNYDTIVAGKHRLRFIGNERIPKTYNVIATAGG